MSMIKLKQELSLSPIEFIKFQLNQAINTPASVLNDTDITILAYVYLYGKDAKITCLKHQILTSSNSFINYISKLKNLGYLERQEGKINPRNPIPPKLNKNIQISDNSFILVSIIHKDDQNVKVYHPYHKAEVV